MSILLTLVAIYVAYRVYRTFSTKEALKKTNIWSPYLDDDGEWIVTIT